MSIVHGTSVGIGVTSSTNHQPTFTIHYAPPYGGYWLREELPMLPLPRDRFEIEELILLEDTLVF